MALLASCWLIIEIFVIPHGFLKWFYLSFYINPFFLVFCQIFLLLKILQSWILLFHCFLCRITDYLSSFIFIFTKRVGIFLLSFTRQPEIEVFYEAMDHQIPEIPTQTREIVVSCINWINSKCDTYCESRFQSVELIELTTDCKDSWLNVYLMSSDHEYDTTLFTDDLDMISDRSLSTGDITSSPCSSFKDQEFICTLEDSGVDYINTCPQDSVITTSFQEDTDSIFHKMYTERMKFFDILYQERLYGTNAILRSPSSLMSTESPMNSSRSKIETKMILKSLESDFELVYVAQSCLSWEALYYQYRTFETLASSNNSQQVQRLFCTNASEKFREFQILLQRFMEDQKLLEGKRNSNYIHRRCQLHVPDVSGSSTEGENISFGGEDIRAGEVLKAIGKCIKTFWIYIETDSKNFFWKPKPILSSRSQAEDPRDLELLYNLAKALHKKGQLLKDFQGKKKGWFKRKVKPLESDMKDDVLFTMIELKLVEMVLKMSVISTSHLEWCQEKLNNLDFKQGKVCRGPKICLFPSS